MQEFSKNGQIGKAAMKAGMSRKTAAKYLNEGKLPSELREPRTYRTRKDPFEDVWADIEARLVEAPGLEAKTLFEDLQEKSPGVFENGQLRTLQRRIKKWRAQEGPAKNVFFRQEHRPGEAAQTDFTWANELGITIAGEDFPHMLCHFVLPYSNWEWATVCHSESIQSLKRGIQSAVFQLGRVPDYHQTDHSTAATHKLSKVDKGQPRVADKEARQGRGFNDEYLALMRHLGMKPRTTNVGAKEQNGDVEALNGSLKRMLRQRLLLRRDANFASLDEYTVWLTSMLSKSNEKRGKRIGEEFSAMKQLRVDRMAECKQVTVRVTSWSTIYVARNTYSIDSRLIGEQVKVSVFDDKIEVRHGEVMQLECPRLEGRGKRSINYRHIIHSLVRKPGAFERWRYREALFPTLVFRRAYDALLKALPQHKANLEYLRCLQLAAETMESSVERAIGDLMKSRVLPLAQAVKEIVAPEAPKIPSIPEPIVNLAAYNELLSVKLCDLAEVAL